MFRVVLGQQLLKRCARRQGQRLVGGWFLQNRIKVLLRQTFIDLVVGGVLLICATSLQRIRRLNGIAWGIVLDEYTVAGEGRPVEGGVIEYVWCCVESVSLCA